MNPVAIVRFIKENAGFRSAVCLIWLVIAISVEAKPADPVHWWAKIGYRQPRWQFPCQTPGVAPQAAPSGEAEALFPLADHYKQVFESTIVLRNKVESLMNKYEREYIQDTFLVEYLKVGHHISCLPSVDDKISVPYDDIAHIKVDKGLLEAWTAFNKLAKFVSYFDVTTKMYVEDDYGIIDDDSMEQSEVTEDIYNVLCGLLAALKRRHHQLESFVANDIIQSEECLAQQVFKTDVRYFRDFAVLHSFDKILRQVVDEFEDLYKKAKK